MQKELEKMWFKMDLRPDLRHIALPVDEVFTSHTHCRKCGSSLVVLPDDKRNGYCFDCTDIMETFSKFEREEGRFFSPAFKNGI